jgi:hypothetical protein
MLVVRLIETRQYANYLEIFPQDDFMRRCWPTQRGKPTSLTGKNITVTVSRWDCLRFPGSKGLFSYDAFALLEGYDLPRGNLGEIFSFAIKPPD